MSVFGFKEKDGTINMCVAGDVTQEAKSIGNGKLVSISVRYGTKKYMDCKAWSDSKVADIMGRLERGDVVEVKGVYESREGKDGKTYTSILADYIGVMTEDGPCVVPEADTEGQKKDQTTPTEKAEGIKKEWDEWKECTQGDEDDDLPF